MASSSASASRTTGTPPGSPLAGGFLTLRYTRDQTVFAPGDRFDPAMPFSRFSRGRDWNEPSFKALDILRPAIAPHGITESEATLRWLAYHSVLKEDLGDAVIIGVSIKKRLEGRWTRGPCRSAWLRRLIRVGRSRVTLIGLTHDHIAARSCALIVPSNFLLISAIRSCRLESCDSSYTPNATPIVSFVISRHSLRLPSQKPALVCSSRRP
jgi:hypothetical protein